MKPKRFLIKKNRKKTIFFEKLFGQTSALKNGLQTFVISTRLIKYPITRSITLSITGLLLALIAVFPLIQLLQPLIAADFDPTAVVTLFQKDTHTLKYTGIAWGALLTCGLFFYIAVQSIFDAGFYGRISEKFKKKELPTHPIVYYFPQVFALNILFDAFKIAIIAISATCACLLFRAWTSLSPTYAALATALLLTITTLSLLIQTTWHKTSIASLVVQKQNTPTHAIRNSFLLLLNSPSLTCALLLTIAISTALLEAANNTAYLAFERVPVNSSFAAFFWLIIYVVFFSLIALMEGTLWTALAKKNVQNLPKISVCTKKLRLFNKSKKNNLQKKLPAEQTFQTNILPNPTHTQNLTKTMDNNPKNFLSINRRTFTDEIFGKIPYNFSVRPENILSPSKLVGEFPTLPKTQIPDTKKDS